MDKWKVLKRIFAVVFIMLFVGLLSSNVFFYLNNRRLSSSLRQSAADLSELNGQLEGAGSQIQALQEEIEELSVPASVPIPPETLEYQSLYPDMKADFTSFSADPAQKTVYLTIDDGPSDNTEAILDILDEYHVKATFFVVCKDNERQKELLKEIVRRGHSIGVHSYTHNYKKIYASVKAFLDDFYKEYTLIYKITGIKPTVFRFPGGSINAYNYNIYQSIIAEMLRRGFVYYDWNVSTNDAAGVTDAAKMAGLVVSQTGGKQKAMLLMHDSDDKKATVEALPEIIQKLTDKGYQFKTVDNTLLPVVFGYKE